MAPLRVHTFSHQKAFRLAVSFLSAHIGLHRTVGLMTPASALWVIALSPSVTKYRSLRCCRCPWQRYSAGAVLLLGSSHRTLLLIMQVFVTPARICFRLGLLLLGLQALFALEHHFCPSLAYIHRIGDAFANDLAQELHPLLLRR